MEANVIEAMGLVLKDNEISGATTNPWAKVQFAKHTNTLIHGRKAIITNSI